MSGDDPDFLEFFAGEFWPLRRVGFLLTGDYPPDWRVERLNPEEGRPATAWSHPSWPAPPSGGATSCISPPASGSGSVRTGSARPVSTGCPEASPTCASTTS